jgi:hypothetical protein
MLQIATTPMATHMTMALRMLATLRDHQQSLNCPQRLHIDGIQLKAQLRTRKPRGILAHTQSMLTQGMNLLPFMVAFTTLSHSLGLPLCIFENIRFVEFLAWLSIVAED